MVALADWWDTPIISPIGVLSMPYGGNHPGSDLDWTSGFLDNEGHQHRGQITISPFNYTRMVYLDLGFRDSGQRFDLSFICGGQCVIN